MNGLRIVLFLLLSTMVSQVFAAADESKASKTGTSAQAAPSGPDISGKYMCSGADSNGENAYSNPLAVSKHGDTYSFEWLSNDTGFAFDVGTGVYNPSVNNAIAVSFWDPKTSKSVAVALYQIKTDGTLDGTWAWLGGKTVSTEQCKKDAKS